MLRRFFTATCVLLPVGAALVGGALLGAAPTGAALADSPKAPPMHEGPNISVQGYGRQNPQCLSWTDGCVLCTTDATTGVSQCSTPGIACQPRGLHCKRMR